MLKTKPKKILLNFIIILSIFLADRLSKIYILRIAELENSVDIYLNSYLNLYLIWNKGIAFGLLNFDDSFIYNIISLIISMVTIIVFIMLIRAKDYEIYALLCIFGGSVGNLFDRIYYSAVPDFIDLHINNFHWFIFNVADIFINESFDYLSSGSKFDIHYNSPTSEFEEHIDSLKQKYPDFEINIVDSDPLQMDNLNQANPFEYDNIIILSQNLTEEDADKIDSDTLIILLLLRKIKSTINNASAKIITQVLNSDNQEIITQTEVDDFIISNKLITMILAQLSEEPLIHKFYTDIFSEDGSEIYVKSIQLYTNNFPLETTFGDLIGLADQREEVCLGIRKGDKSKNPNENFGVTLNLDKNEKVTLNENDFLVVLSEDEL